MSEAIALNTQSATPSDSSALYWDSDRFKRGLARRRRANVRLKAYGITAILLAVGMLTVLLISLIVPGSQAFVQTMVKLPVYVDPAQVDPVKPEAGNYRFLIRASLKSLFPEAMTPAVERHLHDIVSADAQYILRDKVTANPALIGQRFELTVPASDPFDQLNKGAILRASPEDQRRVNDRQIAFFDRLVEQDRVAKPFNIGLFLNADSRFPEIAGMAGALVGSFYALLVCFLISFPVGIAAAVYLEEFAPKNKWTSIIEVNINNLAAVPSIVFGLLGLAVFIGFFGLPRSVPLVGGMVLSLMTLPTFIIVTRAALKSVPPSIRQGAMAVGASPHQVVLHYVLPLSMPGIMTGTIIGMAQALGESAPLLLIGMNAFITSPPGGFLDPATALPTQIYIWADSVERGFVQRTAGGILVLVGFLIVMNLTAVLIRRRLERKW
ncbi:MAG: phosphate ABC transporter permease PstA [Proteobacteria bacterium]|nr:phosphate ABC transporter permease PstA [Pseudomonadota bacterium]